MAGERRSFSANEGAQPQLMGVKVLGRIGNGGPILLKIVVCRGLSKYVSNLALTNRTHHSAVEIGSSA